MAAAQSVQTAIEPSRTIADRLAAVRAEIDAAARAAARDPVSVDLVAVGKTYDADVMVEAIEAGQRAFGENRVQEAAAKWPALKARWPDIRLHLIGPLQTNKVKDIIGLVDVLQTLDRESLAEARQKRDPALLEKLAGTMRDRFQKTEQSLGTALAAKDAAAAVRQPGELRYLRRFLDEAAAIEDEIF